MVDPVYQLLISPERPQGHYQEEGEEDEKGSQGEHIHSRDFFQIVYEFHV